MRQRNDPASELNRLQQVITAANASASRGEAFDLSGLTGEIEALCEHLAAIPGDAARQHLDGLAGLRGELDTLETLLQQARTELTERLERITGQPAKTDKP